MRTSEYTLGLDGCDWTASKQIKDIDRKCYSCGEPLSKDHWQINWVDKVNRNDLGTKYLCQSCGNKFIKSEDGKRMNWT